MIDDLDTRAVVLLIMATQTDVSPGYHREPRAFYEEGYFEIAVDHDDGEAGQYVILGGEQAFYRRRSIQPQSIAQLNGRWNR
jgi:CO dehydrogenase/acetyl-CoA synthase delta subunit